ncbi:unnamed protein product [Phytomonas sp. Hart1]|nr:unnamed protein product [Phytomonas sp. Hart1]|eukprot:CCW69804.1 unnamed protein product [Phytomonas sp. isolate Hart1]
MWAFGSSNISSPQQKSLKEKVSEGSLEVASDVSTLESFLPTTASRAHSRAFATSVKSNVCNKFPCTLASRGENDGTGVEHRNLPRFPYVDNLLSTEAFLGFSTTADSVEGSERPKVSCSAPGNPFLLIHKASSTLNLLSFSDNHSDDQVSPRDRLPLGHDDKCNVSDSNRHGFTLRKLSTGENKHEGDGKKGHMCSNVDVSTDSLFHNQLPIPLEPLKRSPPPFFAVENKSTSVVFLCHDSDCGDAQGLRNPSNSIGGHHFSIAHGGVFMKESCSWREENFYKMLADYQIEMVKEKVRRELLKSHPELVWSDGLWAKYCVYERSCLKVVLGMDSGLAASLRNEEHQDSSVSIKELEFMQRATMRWWQAGSLDNDDESQVIKNIEFSLQSDKTTEQPNQGSGFMLQKAALSHSEFRNDERHAHTMAEYKEKQYVERHRSLPLLARFAPRFYGVRNLIKRQVTSSCCCHYGSDSLRSTEKHPLRNSITGDENHLRCDLSLLSREKIGAEGTTGAPPKPEVSLPELNCEEGMRTASPVGIDRCCGPPTASPAANDIVNIESKTSSPSSRQKMGLLSQSNGEGWIIHTSVPNRSDSSDAKKDDEKGKVCRMIVLEDVCYGFKYPCVLDVKIGSRQYGLNASSTKKASKERKSRLSTSARHYIRLAGIRMWDAARRTYITKTKLYCRSLSISQVKAELSQFLLYSQNLGLAFRRHIEELRDTMRRQKVFRFYTSSLLFIYDAAQAAETARIIMVDFAYTYERWELVEGKDPDAVHTFDEGYIKALDTLISLIS